MDWIKPLLQEYTQVEIANELGVSEPTVSQWKSGERQPSHRAARRIHVIFDIPLEDIRPDIWA